MLIDTHCHLNLDLFDEDLSDVITRSQHAGVERIIVPGIDLETSKKSIQISRNYPEVFTAIGIHPNELNHVGPNDLLELKRLAQNPKVIAIGEIGLDFYHKRSSQEIQIRFFIEQLQLARELDLPVILHSRNSLNEIKAVLQEWPSSVNSQVGKNKLLGVMHSFEGNLQEANQFSEWGFLVSVNGSITFKNAIDRHLFASSIPLESLLLETDAPFIAPEPYRGKRNEPAFLPYIAARISELRQCKIEDIVNQTTSNALELFDFGAMN